MEVRVLLFSHLRQAAGGQEALTRPVAHAGVTLREIWEGLVGDFPELGKHQASLLVAVNLAFTEISATLGSHGSGPWEIAYMPPVQGG